MPKISEERLTRIIDGGDFATRQECEILAKFYRKRKYGKGKWIEWTGGECPVLEGTLIDVKYRGDDVPNRKSVPALDHDWTGYVYWRYDNSPFDIVAYRYA